MWSLLAYVMPMHIHALLYTIYSYNLTIITHTVRTILFHQNGMRSMPFTIPFPFVHNRPINTLGVPYCRVS